MASEQSHEVLQTKKNIYILQQFQAAMSYLILVKDKVHDEMFPVLSDLRGPASVLT